MLDLLAVGVDYAWHIYHHHLQLGIAYAMFDKFKAPTKFLADACPPTKGGLHSTYSIRAVGVVVVDIFIKRIEFTKSTRLLVALTNIAISSAWLGFTVL